MPEEVQAADDAPKPDNAHEEKWLAFWEEHGVYRFDPRSKRPTFSIDTPPPTVSGKMHIGHAYSYNQMDFIARYKRMRGYNLFYPFGFDDNGLPTERYTERQVGVRLQDVGRKEFIRLCLEETKKAEAEMEQSWRRIGTSCDWTLTYRTIDPHAVKTSQASFVELHGQDRAYRAERPSIWCPDCATAIAQVEAEDKELPSTFNDIVFDLVGPSVKEKTHLQEHVTAEDGTERTVYHQGAEGKIVISTTRPELIPACVAIFVNPTNEATKHLIGRKVRVPLTHQEVPVLASDKVDAEKGTGVVMNCTFGDLTDIEWWQANKLPLRVVIDAKGKMTEAAGPHLVGKPIAEARAQVVKDLDHEGRLLGQKHIQHVVNVHERCGTPLEFLVTKQWFVRYLDLKDEFLAAGESIQWHPPYMRVRFDNWVKGLNWDWCISRQRYFGVPFPVWYCGACGAERVAKRDELPVDPIDTKPAGPCACGANDWMGETDVMDTWATSSLTPQIALRWVEDDPVFEKTFPMSLRTQAHEIISFWAFTTVVKAHFHHGRIPWKDIMISGFVKLGKGKKMSKSKGNVVEPLEVIQDWSADALRYWSATGANLGEDIIWNPKDLTRAQRLVTKLRNVANFASRAWQDAPPPERSGAPEAHREHGQPARGTSAGKIPAHAPRHLRAVDRWILTEYSRLVRSNTELWDGYDYVKAQKEVEAFLWHVLADHYLELVKHRLYSEDDPEGREAARYTLHTVALGVLKLFAPVLSFVAEDVYQTSFRQHTHAATAHKAHEAVSIHVAPWPEPVMDDEAGRAAGQLVVDAVAAGRAWKASKGIPLGAALGPVEVVVSDAKVRAAIEANADDLVKTLKASAVVFADPSEFRLEAVGVEPNFATIGPRFRAQQKAVVEALRALDPQKLDPETGATVTLPDGSTARLEKGDFAVKTKPTLHGRDVETVTAGPVTLVMNAA